MNTLGIFLKTLSNNTYRALITTVSIAIFWFFGSWSMGFIPALGAGFAKAEDVKSIQIQMLENAIIDARIRYCTAPNGSQSKLFFLNSVNRLAQDYYELNGSKYPMPRCEELVVASN